MGPKKTREPPGREQLLDPPAECLVVLTQSAQRGASGSPAISTASSGPTLHRHPVPRTTWTRRQLNARRMAGRLRVPAPSPGR